MIKGIVRNIVSDDPTIRRLTLANFINTFGNGMFHTVGIIYFSFIVGLGAQKVALGYTIGAAVSIAISVPAGHLADRYSPKVIGIISFLLQGVVLTAQVFTQSWHRFVVLLMIEYFVERFGQNARMAYVNKFAEGQKRVEARAYMRAVTNLGIGFGTLIAGVALAINTPTAYKIMILADGLTFFLAAIAYSRVPNIAGTISRHEGFDWSILKDHRYIIALLLNGGMTLHFLIQNVAIPVWVVKETEAPRWWLSAIMILNTSAIVLFQVKLSRGVETIKEGVRSFYRASWFVSAACLIYALAHGPSKWVAASIMIIGMAVHVIGELLGSNGMFSIASELADPARMGAYQGLWSMGFGLADMVGAPILVALVIGIGQLGWVYLAIWFLAVGYAMKFHLRNASSFAK